MASDPVDIPARPGELIGTLPLPDHGKEMMWKSLNL